MREIRINATDAKETDWAAREDYLVKFILPSGYDIIVKIPATNQLCRDTHRVSGAGSDKPYGLNFITDDHYA